MDSVASRTRPADLDEKQRAALGRVLLKFSVLRPKAKDLAGISDPWMFKIENYHEVPNFSGSRLFQSHFDFDFDPVCLQYLESFQPPCNHRLAFFFRWAIAKVRMGKDPSRDRNQRNEWNVREIYFKIFKPDEEAVRSLVFETSLLFLWLIVIA